MASYPGTPATFSTKVDNVTTVIASHVNVLQDEVSAIQTYVGTNPQNGLFTYSSTGYTTGTSSINLTSRLINMEVGIVGDVHTQYLKFTGGTLTGKLTTAASTTAFAALRIQSGSAPTSPAAGDLWNESGVIKYYTGSATRALATTDQVNTPTGTFTLKAGTNSTSGVPLKFTTGTNTVWPNFVLGAMEFDGTGVTLTSELSSGPGSLAPVWYYMVSTGSTDTSLALTSTTSAQHMLVNSTSTSSVGDSVILKAGYFYEVEGMFKLLITPGGSNVGVRPSFSFDGTFSGASVVWEAYANSTSEYAASTRAATVLTTNDPTGVGTIYTVNTPSTQWVTLRVKGFITPSAQGSLWPKIQFSNAPTAYGVSIYSGSYLKVTALGGRGNINGYWT